MMTKIPAYHGASAGLVDRSSLPAACLLAHGWIDQSTCARPAYHFSFLFCPFSPVSEPDSLADSCRYCHDRFKIHQSCASCPEHGDEIQHWKRCLEAGLSRLSMCRLFGDEKEEARKRRELSFNRARGPGKSATPPARAGSTGHMCSETPAARTVEGAWLTADRKVPPPPPMVCQERSAEGHDRRQLPNVLCIDASHSAANRMFVSCFKQHLNRGFAFRTTTRFIRCLQSVPPLTLK